MVALVQLVQTGNLRTPVSAVSTNEAIRDSLIGIELEIHRESERM